jgi:hypothetical protein
METMRSRIANPPTATTRRTLATLLIFLAAATQFGCGREFFREWANQDVSEVIFEKSRDPRFRIDMFSIDPPAMSRYADPYDQDFPPAPPDDLVAQSLSPIPQWPDNRLMVPLEGTGYLAMLEEYQPENVARQEALDASNAPGARVISVPGYNLSGPTAAPALPPPTAPSPFAPGTGAPAVQPAGPDTFAPVRPPAALVPPGNSGTTPRQMSPLNDNKPVATPPKPAAPSPARPADGSSVRNARKTDVGVRRTAMQDPATPALPGTDPKRVPADAPDNPASDPLQTPRMLGIPGPREVQDLSKPVLPRVDLSPMQNEEAEAEGTELLGLLGTGIVNFDENQAIGLPSTTRPYIVNMGQSLTLALINARVYQFQLENLYLQALPVTLSRFQFGPQFIAGLSPTTGTLAPIGGGLAPTVNPGNIFNYRTRATGLQASTLSLGTVAGVGKNFDNGVKILASFASQIVFNFTGKNPAQPTVNSFLPMSVVVPFLRGGGRAITLEPLTQNERNLVYQIRSFAKFRQEFLITTLVGGTFANFGTGLAAQGFSGGGNSDPTTGFLNVVEDFVLVENQTRNVQTLTQFSEVYKELIKGESSGVTQLQLDQLDSSLQSARSQLLLVRNQLRNDLDNFKFQLGMPPDTPLTVDRTLTQPFKRVYQEIETWSRNPRRDLSQLDSIAAKLPTLEDVVIDGRSCIRVFDAGNEGTVDNPVDDPLEELLLAAERVSFEHRLDLMNVRAGLYDTWRQIRVTANALKGVLNVNLTNQFLTPPTTTNPFAFVSQAKQFSLVLNAELPLVRLAERNAFRSALINYQRQRRNLQSQEDFQKNQLRQDVRSLQVTYLNYQITKRNFVLSARLKDQSFENIVAPPQGGGTGTAAGNAGGAIQTNNLISSQNSLINFENALVTQWYNYQTARLILYRDLGTLPYDEWEAFYELFPAQYAGIGVGGDGVAGGVASGPSDAPAPAVNRP